MRSVALVVCAVLGLGCRDNGRLPIASYNLDAGRAPRDAGSRPDAPDASPPPDGGLADPPDALVSGPEEMLDLFVVEAGILVVTRRSVALVDREGGELVRWESPRDITAAALDGDRLGIADRAMLTVIATATLEPLSTEPLTFECESAAVVSEHRFLCRTDSIEHEITVHDLRTGSEIFRTSADHERHLPHGAMRGVAGSDRFIAADGNFHLFRVSATGIDGLGSSAPGLLLPRSAIFAPAGSPPALALSSRGVRLRLDGCPGPVPGCFGEDGVVAGIEPDHELVAIDTTATGEVLGVIDRVPLPGTRRVTYCEEGCEIVRFDAALRGTIADAGWSAVVRTIIALRDDPWGGGVVIGTSATCFDDAWCRGWSVTRVAMVTR